MQPMEHSTVQQDKRGHQRKKDSVKVKKVKLQAAFLDQIALIRRITDGKSARS